MIRTILALNVALACGLASSRSAHGQFKSTLNADFSQLADSAGNFDYQLIVGPFGGPSVFSTARWTGPGGVDLGVGRTAVLAADTFAELGAAAFGSWRIEFTPQFPFTMTLGTGPQSMEFSIAPFSLSSVHTKLATIFSPAPGSVIPLNPVTGGVVDFKWAYEDGVAQSGRTFSLSDTGLVVDGDFLGGYPEVYRVQFGFEAGRTSGTARVRAGRYNSAPAAVTGNATFLSVFAPGSTWRNFSAEASYTFVATPEPNTACAAGIGLAMWGGRLRSSRRRAWRA